MALFIKLDCDVTDEKALYQHKAALLSATKMYHDYLIIKLSIPGTGPELFAENWIHEAIRGVDIQFENLIIIYFAKILLGALHGN